HSRAGTLRNNPNSYPARFEAPASCRRNRFYPFLSSCRHLAGLGRHYAVEFRIFRETVNKGQNHVAIEDKSLARFGMGYIGHLLLRNVKLPGKDFPVALGLVEHTDKIAVFKNV